MEMSDCSRSVLLTYVQRPAARKTSARRGQFKATELWNAVVTYVRENVEVGRRRAIIKQHDHCFTGAEAVDVALQWLNLQKGNFTRDVTREKAVKLCQLMLDSGVFEPVNPKAAKTFEDQGTKLFRFLPDPDSENSDSFHVSHEVIADKARCTDSDGKYGAFYNPAYSSGSKHSHLVQEIMDITGTWRRHSVEHLRKITPAKLFPNRKSRSEEDVSREEDHEMKREVALSFLLQLIDLPVVESIVSEKGYNSQKEGMAFNNLAFKQQDSSILSGILPCSRHDDDEWMEAATDVVNCISNGSELLDASMAEDTGFTQKLRLYQSIADHYSARDEALWPDAQSDLHYELYSQLMQGRRDVVLRALQLSMVLIPTHVREELRCLLNFMRVAAEDEAVKLSVKVKSRAARALLELRAAKKPKNLHQTPDDTPDCNRTHIQAAFTRSVLRSKLLAPHQAAQLVAFMMDHAQRLFTEPPDLQVALTTAQGGADAASASDVTYCARITEDEYKKQSEEGTQEALIDLYNGILENATFSVKEKKHHIKQLQKHHPELYRKHFSHISW